MKVSEEKLKDVFKYTDLDYPPFFNNELDYFDALNKDKFALYGSGIKEKNTYARFLKEDIDKIKIVSDDVAWPATHSAGLKLKFKTDSRLIRIRVLENDIFSMKNMSFMGQCGFDVYYYDDEKKMWIYHNTTFPNYIDNKKYLADLLLFRDKKVRDLIIHFPLYLGVLNLEIGLEKGSVSTPSYYKNDGKIVCYGTSILQGGSVSRPGLNITNVLAREFDKDVINFGFSGAGKMEKEVAEAIAKIDDIDLLIIDAEANAGCDRWMYDRFDDFLNVFYKKFPNLPVIIMNKTRMAIDDYIPRNRDIKEFYDEFLVDRVEAYKKLGHKITFVDNYHLFDVAYPNYSECTIDGVHPNDLGMNLLVLNYIKEIYKIIK